METFENEIERAAPPIDLPALSGELDALAAALPAMLRRDPVTLHARRRRRRQRILTGAAGLAILAGAAPAAAGYVGLHTGIFGDDAGHHGEVLNLSSPDVLPVLRQYEQQYPLPPGQTWTSMEQRWTTLWRADAGAFLGQVGIIEEAAGFESQCQWEGAWLTAHRTGDSVAAKAAAQVLAEIPRWHVITAYDADGVGARLDAELAKAAAAGDPTLAQESFTANCADAKPGT